MNFRPFLFLSLATLSSPAQRGLDDIPDPDPIKQKAAFNLPEGMEIELFASDPMIGKPVQINFDTQGRLWLVSSGLYPHIRPGAEENDRVLILEDTNGDGTADKRTVFADDLHIPTAVMPADGGAYVANSTEILFLRDTDGDGVADERRVVLSGFGTEDTHHLVHTFEQGPDGLLYFLQSIYIHSHLETPHGVRRLMGGGIWHFRPETGQAEVLSKGLINPWGFAFDDYGQTFATDGAGGNGINFIFPRSVFAASPGAQRIMQGLNPGEPKLCGLEILSGPNVPEDLQGVMISPDFRGHRINSYRLTPNGSSYTSRKIDDLLSSSHRAFRPIDVKMGPDGALYIADWYNPIIQHGEVDFRDKRRDHTHGRIWRVTFKDRPTATPINMAKASTEELLSHTISTDRYHRKMARRELRTRKSPEAISKLQIWEKSLTSDFEKLQALWNNQALNRTQVTLLHDLLASEDSHYRAAALRVLYHRHHQVSDADALLKKAIQDKNAQVRLWAVSCLAQRPSPTSVPTALQALDQPLDKSLDFALWSIVREHADHWVPPFEAGQEPFGGKITPLLFAMKALDKPLSLDPVFAKLDGGTLSPRQMNDAFAVIAQAGSAQDLAHLADQLKSHPSVIDYLTKAAEIRKLQPSENKEAILPLLEGDHFEKAARLAGLWKFLPAKNKIIETYANDRKKAHAALKSLTLYGGSKVITFLHKVTHDSPDEATLSLAVRELAKLAPEKAAAEAANLLSRDVEGRDQYHVLDIFLASPKASTALALALKGKTLPQKIATLGLQRAGTSGNPPQDLMDALKAAGNLKPISQDLTAPEMARLVDRVKKEGDPHRGETIYRRTDLQCLACHAIGGVGSPIGPDLVSIGSSAPIDYLITSLINPNDKIKEGYHTTLVTEKNGATHTGGLISDGDKEVILRDYLGKENRIAKSDVETIVISPISMMPPGLTASLREDEMVDLVRFLSELGKEGEFKVSSRPLIRDWKALQPHPRTVDLIGHYGPAIFAEKFDGYQWQPYGGKVNGELLPAELPPVAGRGRSRWGVARFSIDPSIKGTVKLKINETQLMTLFDGQKKLELPPKGPAVIEVPAGGDSDRFTLALNSARRSAPLLIEVLSE